MAALLLALAVLTLAAAGVLAAAALAPRRPVAQAAIDQIENFYGRATVATTIPRRELSPLLDRLRGLVDRITPASTLAKLEHNLDLAGNPAAWRLDRLLAYKGAGAAILCGLGLAIGIDQGPAVVLFAGTGAVAGFLLPNLLLYNLGLKRQTDMQQALPDAMDMMTVCVEAGLGFDAALSRVARNTQGPLASELARVLQEMQFGLSRVEALKALVLRTTVPEFKTLVSALVQASKLGIPVAAVMREQASEMRLRRRQRAEEKAQKVVVKILFPLIFCLLPALFIIVLGPGVINIINALSGV